MMIASSEPLSKELYSNFRASFESDGFVVLGECVPDSIRDSLLRDITASYSSGQTDEEKEHVAYVTSCRSMVDEAWARWQAEDRESLILNQLANQMLGTAGELLKSAPNLSCGPVQIAVREPGHKFPAPHIDGYSPDEKAPNTPRAIVGVYLTKVESQADGALLIWPGKREEIARLRSAKRYGDAKEIAESSKTSDLDAEEVLGKPGAIFVIDGSVPHGNAERTKGGLRVAVYLRVY
ncbi:phytanoyl-CoA dioxygenase family protein [Ralstonia pseudosolanacearum]